MPFYYPFPISRLSRDELLCVVSAWLGHGPKSADAVSYPGGSFSSSSPISVPMVYSHDEWFVQCVPPLSSSLISFLDEDELDETALLAPLRLILGLIMRIPMRIRSREEMPHFLGVFVALLRSSERPMREQIRRLAQKTLVGLLNRFEPLAQFLLLSRLFELICSNELDIASKVYEPQLLGWMTDIYRTKCFGAIDDEPNECRELFRRELGHFYAQIGEVVYEDPFIAVNFYSSVSLLIQAQAIHRHWLALLRFAGQPWVQKTRSLLGDWMELRKLKKAGKGEEMKRGNEEDEVNFDLREGSIESSNYCERDGDQARLGMFTFQLDETEKRIIEAFDVSEQIK